MRLKHTCAVETQAAAAAVSQHTTDMEGIVTVTEQCTSSCERAISTAMEQDFQESVTADRDEQMVISQIASTSGAQLLAELELEVEDEEESAASADPEDINANVKLDDLIMEKQTEIKHIFQQFQKEILQTLEVEGEPPSKRIRQRHSKEEVEEQRPESDGDALIIENVAEVGVEPWRDITKFDESWIRKMQLAYPGIQTGIITKEVKSWLRFEYNEEEPEKSTLKCEWCSVTAEQEGKRKQRLHALSYPNGWVAPVVHSAKRVMRKIKEHSHVAFHTANVIAMKTSYRNNLDVH